MYVHGACGSLVPVCACVLEAKGGGGHCRHEGADFGRLDLLAGPTRRCELTKLGAEVGLQSRIQESPFSSANVAAGSPVTMHQPAPPTPKTAPPGPAAVTPTTASPKGGLPGWRTASPRASSSSSPTGTPTARVAADGLRRFANTFAAWNKSDAPAAPDAPTQVCTVCRTALPLVELPPPNSLVI